MMSDWGRRRRRSLSNAPRTQLSRRCLVRWAAVTIIVLCILSGSVCLAQEEVDKEEWTEGNNAKDGGVNVGSPHSNSTFWGAFWNSVGMILATEIGDKTFFLAALMAMQNPRIIVLFGAITSLAFMTVLSAAMGLLLPSIVPKSWMKLAGSFLFLYFGIKMIKEGLKAGVGPSDELIEVEHELLNARGKPKTEEPNGIYCDSDIENGMISKSNSSLSMHHRWQKWIPCSELFASQSTYIFSTVFTMTLLAEWGDRSQIATIALAASKDALGVTVGGIVGHCACTTMAVLGGRVLASSISERNVHIGGGVMFLLFALQSCITGYRSL